jgi:hypothetical protein
MDMSMGMATDTVNDTDMNIDIDIDVDIDITTDTNSDKDTGSKKYDVGYWISVNNLISDITSDSAVFSPMPEVAISSSVCYRSSWLYD